MNATTLLAALVAAQTVAILFLARRPQRVRYESLDAAVDATTRVVAALHEDIDGLRKEIRALAALPPESRVPQLAREVHVLRLGLALQTIILLFVVGGLGWVIGELQRWPFVGG